MDIAMIAIGVLIAVLFARIGYLLIRIDSRIDERNRDMSAAVRCSDRWGRRAAR